MDVILDAASAAWAHTAAIAPKLVRVSVTASIAVAALFALFVFVCRRFVFAQRTRRGGNWVSIAFFHPYCNSGGGGERVLWQGIQALQSLGDAESDTKYEIVIYSGDEDINMFQAREAVEKRFGIELESHPHVTLKFEYIRSRYKLEASRYPRFTMLLQSLGAMMVAWECVRKYNPDIFFDTTGWAFSYFVAKGLARCKVVTYTHYPTITSDMLHRVHEQRPTYNNTADVSSSAVKTTIKVMYYRLFAFVYGLMGRLVDTCMCNSKWTREHLVQLWGHSSNPIVVSPPCNTEVLAALDTVERQPWVLSVGQFRQEKDHALQLRSFKALLDKGDFPDTKLVMVGGCRSDVDQQFVEELKALAKKLSIQDKVEFRVNAPIEELKELLATCSVGIHTMWNEHFGIGVVEMMAAGMVVVAHNSGGPKSDIVLPFQGQRTGYLAATPDEYASAMAAVLTGGEEVDDIRDAAVRSVAKRFSDSEFSLRFFANVVGLAHDIQDAKRGQPKSD